MHDDIAVGDEGRVCLAFERAVGDHEGDVKLLTSKAAAGGRCCIDGPSLLKQYGGGYSKGHVPIHEGSQPSSAHEHGGVDSSLPQHFESAQARLE